MMHEAGRQNGLPIVTEVVHPKDVEAIAREADVLQIGARNMQNFELLKEVGKSHAAVLLKRSLSSQLLLPGFFSNPLLFTIACSNSLLFSTPISSPLCLGPPVTLCLCECLALLLLLPPPARTDCFLLSLPVRGLLFSVLISTSIPITIAVSVSVFLPL